MRTSVLVGAFAALLALPPAARAAGTDAVRLLPAEARITGGAQCYAFGGFIGSWTDANAVIEWDLDVREAGKPEVSLAYACAPGHGGDFTLAVGGATLPGKTAPTGGWYDVKTIPVGAVELAAGRQTLRLTAGPFRTAPMNVFAVTLSPLKGAVVAAPGRTPPRAVIVPNFHPASCGWLANWSVERNYCANTYLDHLDRVRDDPAYAFAISEVNNLIAIRDFEPARFEELKARIREGRVEAVNAFFLESTINLSGGEALVKLGVEGLRWQQAVLGVRPRFGWIIDVCGVHDQTAQIAAGLGLDALVYCRHNPTPTIVHWMESPDGTRALAISPGHYSEWGEVFGAKAPLPADKVRGLLLDLDGRAEPPRLTEAEVLKRLEAYWPGTPRRAQTGVPVLVLAGSGDYALAPQCPSYPSELLRQFKAESPAADVRFATPSVFLDAVLPGVREGRIDLPVMRGGTRFSFDAFWIQCPRVKAGYRRSEHALQAAEALAAAASLTANAPYPAEPLNRAWLLLGLNMDRNTLWGAAGGMVFEHPESWDVKDRFDWVDACAAKSSRDAVVALRPEGKSAALFNFASWKRDDPVALALPAGTRPAGMPSQALPDGRVLCRPALPATGLRSLALEAQPPPPAASADLPAAIETAHYAARIDPATGALVSLRLKPSGREVLGGPANAIVAEKTRKQQGDPGDYAAYRAGRDRKGDTNAEKPEVSVLKGPLATQVEIRGTLLGAPCRRVVRFHADHPRIDFETELQDVPDRTIVVAEFPLAADVTDVRRGVPYGFAHGAWPAPDPARPGYVKDITPAVRWSHYALAGGGGVAILDRGLTGREITGRTPVLFLLNASDKYYGYPNAWLTGKGTHRLEYALVAHDGDWKDARIPHLAWEYNAPPVVVPDRGAGEDASYVEASPNVIVEAVRREGPELEIRLAEALGVEGTAEVTVRLPHQGAALTNLVGGRPVALAGGPTYRFPVRPQQIVTLRLKTAAAAPEVKPLLQWDDLVPEAKRKALRTRITAKGHPPRGK
jgi:alpha-mannosidase